MSKIRVVHIITRMCKGGAQENTFHTCRLLDHDRYEVDLITGPVPPEELSMETVLRDHGIPVTGVPTLCRAPNPGKDWASYKSMIDLIGARKPHIVHTHTSKAGIIGRYAARNCGVPGIVHTPHGHIFTGYFAPMTTRFFVEWERRAARFTDRLIALTDRGIDDHLERQIGRRDQWTAIFSGVDLSPYDAARARRDHTRAALGIGPDEILVGAVGRLEPVKGFSYVVEAAREITAHHADVRFALAGDGSQRALLAAAAAPMGDRFRMIGYRDYIPNLMAAFDIFVLPSVNEGMGRVLLEAGAAGTPCVATAVGGVPEIVMDGETGVLVAPRSGSALATGIAALAADASLRQRMGAAARDRVVPHYSLETMVRRIEAVYEAILKEKCIDA